MALQTTTQIFISGVPVQSYISMELHQEIDAHHDLTLVCRADVLERLSEELIGESKEYLGGVITLKISSIAELGGYKELEFKGLVTEINATKGFHQASGDLITIYAKSTSILSEDGNHFASFSELNLSEILDRTFQGYDKGKLTTNFAPVSSDTIQYSVQHNQSSFSFVSRLASYYNEWFYYDGQQLIFGSPGTKETELSYGVDLQNFTVKLKTIPNAFEYLTNDYVSDEIFKKSSDEVSTSSDGYHGFMNTKSNEMYHKKTQIYHNPQSDTSLKSRFDTQVEQYTRAKSIHQAVAIGSSDNPGVNLGEIITVKGYGRFRVTKVTHTNTEGGVYQNHFEAIDANSTDYPLMDIGRYPKSEIQVAKVVENSDPQGMSRIRVQFPWQKKTGEMTPWIRLMTPHAGADKGFHFIPEKGEEIIVNFEGGNAERPFVMGALYNGSAKPDSWQSATNDIKAIKTRAGSLIELNDKKGAECITITDINSNIIRIDTANNSIEVSALENLTLNAKNVEINAAEEIKMNAGTNMITRVSEDFSINAKNATEMIEENKTSLAKEIMENADKIRIESAKDNMELVSAKQVDIQGSENVKLF
ncbi:type VI secretion system Vgr family protein [Aquimarina sp. RZ0]|uniref:type VI secretion system Vgr family protein n=1 Tax=Aquimarina sp. RZ0 TaxID=2607730 RepID=UPI0011F156CB|nr:phage baseplate assembly protein V [Aquimarina sp. RZ0]KAA1243337.1 hypothetical protein F0000_21555 [Aquimarina sp. RZ0]